MSRVLVGKRKFGVALPIMAAVALAMGAASAQAEGDTIAKRLWLKTGAGKAVTLDSWREMREDCSLAPAPQVTVTQQPSFGKLTVSKTKAAGKTDPGGPYAACNGKPFNWTVVKVPSPAKGEGSDKAVLAVQESSGEITTYDVEIVFAKTLPAGKTAGLLEDR
ncbi:MAG: hypothetical protein LWW93_01410 [Hyphomicrobiales bacterium]|nr:hypothetical protein [Hyphomicrobiales bacterium]